MLKEIYWGNFYLGKMTNFWLGDENFPWRILGHNRMTSWILWHYLGAIFLGGNCPGGNYPEGGW